MTWYREPPVVATPPRRIPRVGVVLDLAEDQWVWGGRPLRFRVDAVRLDISQWCGGNAVWVVGAELDAAGRAVVEPSQALVFCSAIGDDQLEESS